MKRLRMRFTVRRLMIAVVLIGIMTRAAGWVIEMESRSAAYLRRAEKYALKTARLTSRIYLGGGVWFDRYENENTRLRDAWARAMAEKYGRLSDYPWLPAEPDLPPPTPLAHPKPSYDLPQRPESAEPLWSRGSSPPAWTFLWTRRR